MVHDRRSAALVTLALLATPRLARADATPPAIGTQAHAGDAAGLSVDVKVQGPSAQATPLQIACVFEYAEGDLTGPNALPAAVNGMVHLDRALGGLITELRKSGKFEGHALETLLVVPPKGTIAAERLLLVGLGGRRRFSAEVLRRVGVVEAREALRLGVSSFSHASDVKDAGVASSASDDAVAVVSGVADALATQRVLARHGMTAPSGKLTMTYLAGPSFFATTTVALRDALGKLTSSASAAGASPTR